MKNGVIIINKEESITSQGAVNRVKRLLSVSKAGHTGTLDPMATGVLPVLVGRGVKASEYMLSSDKHYKATLLLGITTDTEDVTGSILTKSDTYPDEIEVMDAIRSMLGTSMQTPPMYSAIKIGGKKLYDLAREGITVEREAREITVKKIEGEKLSETEYTIDVICSKGTYIRTICADIGRKLGCGAVMKTLMRCEAAGFTLEDSVTLTELEKMSEEEKEKRILPIEVVFEKYRKITLPPFFARLARSGLEIYLNKIGYSGEEFEKVRICDSTGFFALGEILSYDNGLAIKPIKQFDV